MNLQRKRLLHKIEGALAVTLLGAMFLAFFLYGRTVGGFIGFIGFLVAVHFWYWDLELFELEIRDDVPK